VKSLAAILITILGAAILTLGEDPKPLTIITLSGEKFENGVVTRVEPDAVTITHSAGVARIPFSNLPPELRTQLGFDAEKLAAFNAAQAAAAKARAEAEAQQQKNARAEQQRIDSRRAHKLAALRRWASQNLMVASREDQLRAAMGAKFFQQRGGKPLSAAEFQFLDDQTKIAIILYQPEMLPPELLDE
jgi:monoamine oxidase